MDSLLYGPLSESLYLQTRMTKPDILDTDVLIVGGGPVGLFLGCLLTSHGVNFRILEKRSVPSLHTRSIGIHPPALELLALAGVADTLIENAVKVTAGAAFGTAFGTVFGTAFGATSGAINGGTGRTAKRLGTLSFSTCPGPYPFVLSIPQFRTESILRQRLRELASSSITFGCEVVSIHEDPEGVTAQLDSGERIRARILAGCDGKNSIVRKSAGFQFTGSQYADRYAMGDFDAHVDLGCKAGIFLSRDGLVESFPLPGNIRRWVVRERSREEIADSAELARVVLQRTGYRVSVESSSMFSSFRTNAYLANPLSRGRIFLAGDAAHIISPIGGQGMNLGWLDAFDLSLELRDILQGQTSAASAAEQYSRRRAKAYRVVKRRSEFNMWMGREGRSSAAKQLITRIVLSLPLKSYFASRFSMRGIPGREI